MRVLHVNVRLLEGGAAGVARDIHLGLSDDGVESKFAYGWGERGGKSSAEFYIPESFQVGVRAQVASNILVHGLIGVDFFRPTIQRQKEFISAIRWADIVHLHAIHSYFMPLSWLVGILTSEIKPVLWTAHDYWMITGRCAFTEGCEGWKDGCGKCPSNLNYPKSFFDFSANQFVNRRREIKKIKTQLTFVAPTDFVALALKTALLGYKVEVVSNWIDAVFEESVRKITLSNNILSLSCKDRIRLLVIANNLSDSGKVDPDFIQEIMKYNHVELVSVGQNSPFHGVSVENHGKIACRVALIKVIQSCDVVLFTSVKDTFGLVMIEALACGVPVFAVHSSASIEVLCPLALTPFKKSEILEFVRSRTLPSCYGMVAPARLSESVFEHYSRNVGLKKYSEIYRKMLDKI